MHESWYRLRQMLSFLPSMDVMALAPMPKDVVQRTLMACFMVSALIPFLQPYAMSLGWADRPGGRKMHDAPTAMHGGVCILIAMAGTALLFGDEWTTHLMTFYGCATLMLLVGLLDDRFDLNWKVRIGTQALAAVLMALVAGVSVQHVGDVVGVPGLTLGWLALPVSIFIVVGVINALNMSDGSDGLAGGQVLVSLLLFAAFALYAGNVVMVERLLVAAGAVFGFLMWNFRRPGMLRANVFLGDAGSMVLGLLIAWMAIRLSQDAAHPISPVLGPWTIAIPLIDCVSLIFRRWRSGRSPFAADRNHLHHLLQDAGFSPARIAGGLMIVSAVLGLSAAITVKLGIYRPALVWIFVGLIVMHYRLTSDRARAVAFLRSLRGAAARLADANEVPAIGPAFRKAHNPKFRRASRGPKRRRVSSE